VNLPVQHLSDEAIAAFADDVLAAAARNRAARHIAECGECAAAIDEQHLAVSVLRAAPAPTLPAGLLERLRAVPVTTPLRPQHLALAPDGSAVFPAFGTVLASGEPVAFARPAHRHEFHLPLAMPHAGRRTQQLALVAVAAAFLTVGLAASASADTGSSSSPVRSAPAGANPVRAASFTGNQDDNELVSSVVGKHH
jgi:hypothetical protein